MPIALIALVAMIAAAGAVLSRRGARWWFERSNAMQFARGPEDVVIGAEHIALHSEGRAAVLLLHGFGDTPQTLRRLAEHLHARGYGVSVPLLPGHGRTLPRFVESESSQWIAHAEAALADLRGRYEEVGLIGLSMGGALATILGAGRVDIRTMMLIAPYVSVSHTVRRLARWRGVVNHVLPYFPSMGRRSIHDARARGESLAYGAMNASILSELVAIVDRADASLPALTLPVLMMQSRIDNRIPPEAANRTFARIGSAEKQLIWLDASGHVLTVDRERDRVIDEATRWLARTMPVVSSEIGQ